MKLLVDENLGRSFTQWLRQRGHDAVTTHDLGLASKPDTAIADRAIREQRIVITRDSDFGTLVFRDRLPLLGVLLVKYDWRIRARFNELLRGAWDELENDLAGSVISLSESGARREPIPRAAPPSDG